MTREEALGQLSARAVALAAALSLDRGDVRTALVADARQHLADAALAYAKACGYWPPCSKCGGRGERLRYIGPTLTYHGCQDCKGTGEEPKP